MFPSPLLTFSLLLQFKLKLTLASLIPEDRMLFFSYTRLVGTNLRSRIPLTRFFR